MGEALLPPYPHPIGAAVGRTSTGCSRGRRSSSVRRSSSPDARPPTGRAAPVAWPFLSVRLLPLSVGGSSKLLPIVARHRCVLSARLAGGRESLLFLPLSGGSVASPTPPSNRQGPSGPSSTVGSRRLHVPCRHSSSVLLSRLLKEAARRASSSTHCVSWRLSLVGRAASRP